MKKKLVSLILILTIPLISGCTEQQGSNNLHIVDNQFTVNQAGGIFSSDNNEITLTIPENALTNETIITVKTSSKLPEHPDYTAFCCYDFGPNDTQFNIPVTLQMIYETSEVPAGANEEDIMLCTNENNDFVEIEGYQVDTLYNSVQAAITHFGKYFLSVGVKTETSDDSTDSSDNDSSEIEEGSILWTGEPYIYFTERSTESPEGHNDPYEDFVYYAYFLWEPHSFTRYYELIYYFNGNNPESYCWHCTWRNQGKDWCTPSVYPVQEEIIYEFCDKVIPIHNRPYKDCPVFLEVNDKCAISLITIKDTFYESEDLSEIEIIEIKNQMRTFVQTYVDGWTGSVRAIA